MKLLKLQCDVIVNSTQINLDLSAGAVSSSINKMAGPDLQREARRKYPNGIRHNELAVTGGHNLYCQKIFHGALHIYEADKHLKVCNIQHLNIYRPILFIFAIPLSYIA